MKEITKYVSDSGKEYAYAYQAAKEDYDDAVIELERHVYKLRFTNMRPSERDEALDETFDLVRKARTKLQFARDEYRKMNYAGISP